jgi:hypothetical protein
MREPMALNSTVNPIEPSTTLRFRNTDLRVDPFPESPETPSTVPGLPGFSDSRLTTPGPDNDPDADGAMHRYRTIWLSDIHLGSGGCQATYLLDFLRHNESEYLYLVGDIIDGWQ